MRQKATTMTLIMASLLCSTVSADSIHGVWEGKFTSGNWKDTAISAKVIAEAEGKYRIQFSAKTSGWPQVEIWGQSQSSIAVFLGQANLGRAFKGNYVVTAEAVKGAMTGTFYQKNETRATFKLKRANLKSPTLGLAAPKDAIVLFDGTNLDAFQARPSHVVNGTMGVASKRDYVSKQQFGSHTLHLEFMPPLMPDHHGQARGNSGVYVQGRYEVQVLDSFGDPVADNHCGGIYSQSTPSVNASFPPATWQTYDITFLAPKFDASGK
ncbi:MAG: DUF1080 domain-containing protein, partial [Planctomycetes bacterium]|nr:DUF1080 domain-containing protein [Planctomycetota bacterium]